MEKYKKEMIFPQIENMMLAAASREWRLEYQV
jgi:hypothetical protein